MLKDLRGRYNGDLAEMLGQLIEHAPDGIVTVDEEQNIVMYNRAAERMFGYTMDEVLGQSLTKLLPDRVKDRHHKYVERFNKEHESGSCDSLDRKQFEGCRKNGECFPCDITVSKTVYKGTIFFTAMVRDVTDRVRREKRIKEQDDELQEYRKQKKAELLTEVHEIMAVSTSLRF